MHKTYKLCFILKTAFHTSQYVEGKMWHEATATLADHLMSINILKKNMYILNPVLETLYIIIKHYTVLSQSIVYEHLNIKKKKTHFQ